MNSSILHIALVLRPAPDIAHYHLKTHPFGWVLCSKWCNQLDLNQRPPPSQGGALIQLSYGCKCEQSLVKKIIFAKLL
jgi:hypothetical protein